MISKIYKNVGKNVDIIIHCFSCRVHGLRKYKAEIVKDNSL